jgi:hypothetical protein
MTRWRKLVREPLLHFLLLGAALFLWYAWSGGGSGPGSSRIVLTAGQIDYLVTGFERTWQRPPTESELKGLIDDWVKEEIATREAMAMGLDRDDVVLRRRLRQKLEFLVEDVVDQAPATDADLEAWIAAHADAYRTEPSVALRQVYVSFDRRGEGAQAEARRLLAELERRGPEAPIEDLGDALMLPPELPLAERREVASVFGTEFAGTVVALEPGRWSGPVRSGFGLHLVLVTERRDGRLPALEEIRTAVERDFTVERRRRQLASLYERLLEKYTVVIEREEPPEGAS